MATIQDCIDEIQADLRTLSGIRGAPDEPPEDIAAYPFIVCYPGSGAWAIGPPELMTGLHDVVIELHVARKDLARDVATANSYATSIPDKILSNFKDGNYTNFQTFESISYVFVPMAWAGQATIGYRFTVNALKMQETIS